MSEKHEESEFPPQQQSLPGSEQKMDPKPKYKGSEYCSSNKLAGKVALVTGGDSGIGRSVAILFAREGADVAISYLKEHKDAEKTKREVEKVGRRCELIPGDIGDEQFCCEVVERTVQQLGGIDILVNNAGEQHYQEQLENITSEQLERTFRTNIFSMFYLTKAALKHMGKGASIINTTSVTAYAGMEVLVDYSATKGAIVTFTRSLSGQLADRGIRVNAVAPGPIWTPLIPGSFPEDKVKEFGKDVPMKRAGQPEEVAPAFVFLASNGDSSYMSGQVLHVNGGKIVNG